MARQAGRGAVAATSTGSWPWSWIASGSIAAVMASSCSAPASAVTATMRGSARGRGARAGEGRELGRLVEGQLARRPRHEVEADGVGAGPDRGQHAVRIGDAADLHERSPRHLGRIGRRPAGGDEGTGGRGRVGRAHERLADERRVEPEGAPAGDDRRVADARLGDDDAVVGHQRAQAVGPGRVDVERAQVAVVQADEPGAGRERCLELALVMGLDEWLQPELDGTLDEGAPGRRGRAGRRAAGRASAPAARRTGSCRCVDDELLGQDRDGHAGADAAQVVDRATEPVRFAQDRDRRGAAGLVGACLGDEVEVGSSERVRPTATSA